MVEHDHYVVILTVLFKAAQCISVQGTSDLVCGSGLCGGLQDHGGYRGGCLIFVETSQLLYGPLYLVKYGWFNQALGQPTHLVLYPHLHIDS